MDFMLKLDYLLGLIGLKNYVMPVMRLIYGQFSGL